MYHFPNQQVYHHNAYEQRPVFIDHSKYHAVACSTQNNPFEPVFSQKIVTRPSDNTRRQQEGHRESTKLEKNKKTEKTRKSVDTSNFSIEERLVAAVWVHERKMSKTSMSQIKHEFRQRFGREPPAKNTLLVWERKLFSSGSVCDAPRPGRPVNRKCHVDEVAASVRTTPSLSLRARALALRVPRTTLRTILHKDLSQTSCRSKVVNQNPLGKAQMRKVKKQVFKKRSEQDLREPSAALAPAGLAPLQHYTPISQNIHTHTTYT